MFLETVPGELDDVVRDLIALLELRAMLLQRLIDFSKIEKMSLQFISDLSGKRVPSLDLIFNFFDVVLGSL